MSACTCVRAKGLNIICIISFYLACLHITGCSVPISRSLDAVNLEEVTLSGAPIPLYVMVMYEPSSCLNGTFEYCQTGGYRNNGKHAMSYQDYHVCIDKKAFSSANSILHAAFDERYRTFSGWATRMQVSSPRCCPRIFRKWTSLACRTGRGTQGCRSHAIRSLPSALPSRWIQPPTIFGSLTGYGRCREAATA